MQKSLVVVLCCLSMYVAAQNTFILKGRVLDESGNAIVFPVIANKTQNIGMVANTDAGYCIKVNKKDTLLFSSVGYYLQRICFADSQNSAADTIYLDIVLQRNVRTLKEVTVYDIKTLKELQKQKDELGEKNTNTYQKVNPLESPFTALYELFSKTERQKREVEKMENKDRRNAFLKELLRNYISYDILDMDDETLEDFIDFMGLSDDFIKSTNEYQLADYITKAYGRYKAYKAAGGK